MAFQPVQSSLFNWNETNFKNFQTIFLIPLLNFIFRKITVVETIYANRYTI